MTLRRVQRSKVTFKLVREASWCVLMARYKGGTGYKNNSLENEMQVKKL